MTGGMHCTPSYTNVSKVFNFQDTFSPLTLHLQFYSRPAFLGYQSKRVLSSAGIRFLMLANFNLFEFSAAILEKGLLCHCQLFTCVLII